MLQPCTPFPASLSPREAQVLCLVATGLSNRQVTERLSISPCIVAEYFAAIDNETVSENRTAVVAWAICYRPA